MGNGTSKETEAFSNLGPEQETPSHVPKDDPGLGRRASGYREPDEAKAEAERPPDAPPAPAPTGVGFFGKLAGMFTRAQVDPSASGDGAGGKYTPFRSSNNGKGKADASGDVDLGRLVAIRAVDMRSSDDFVVEYREPAKLKSIQAQLKGARLLRFNGGDETEFLKTVGLIRKFIRAVRIENTAYSPVELDGFSHVALTLDRGREPNRYECVVSHKPFETLREIMVATKDPKVAMTISVEMSDQLTHTIALLRRHGVTHGNISQDTVARFGDRYTLVGWTAPSGEQPASDAGSFEKLLDLETLSVNRESMARSMKILKEFSVGSYYQQPAQRVNEPNADVAVAVSLVRFKPKLIETLRLAMKAVLAPDSPFLKGIEGNTLQVMTLAALVDLPVPGANTTEGPAFSYRRFDAVAQYTLALLSQCKESPSEINDMIIRDVAVSHSSQDEAMTMLAKHVAAASSNTSVKFEYRRGHLDAARGGDGKALLKLDLNKYDPKFAPFIFTIFVFLAYGMNDMIVRSGRDKREAGGLWPFSSDDQNFLDSILLTFENKD